MSIRMDPRGWILSLKAIVRGGLFLAVIFLVDGAPQAVQHGILKVRDHCSVVLDGGRVECVVKVENDDVDPKQYPAEKHFDFWFQASNKGLFLNPMNRTMFAKAKGDGEPGCHGVIYKRDRIRIETSGPGAHVCVLTRERKYGELTLEGPPKSPDDPWVFSYAFGE